MSLWNAHATVKKPSDMAGGKTYVIQCSTFYDYLHRCKTVEKENYGTGFLILPLITVHYFVCHDRASVNIL